MLTFKFKIRVLGHNMLQKGRVLVFAELFRNKSTFLGNGVKIK